MIKYNEISHDGKTYEVRATIEDNRAMVGLFCGDKRASPVVYGVEIETYFDAKLRGFSLDLIDELMDQMERDLRSGRLKLFPSN